MACVGSMRIGPVGVFLANHRGTEGGHVNRATTPRNACLIRRVYSRIRRFEGQWFPVIEIVRVGMLDVFRLLQVVGMRTKMNCARIGTRSNTRVGRLIRSGLDVPRGG